MEDYEALLNEYAATVVERAQSNLRIKRRVRGKVVNRVASGNLLNSLIYKLRIRYNKPTIDFTVKGDAGRYADVIEYGRKPYPGDPTKRPPYKDIMQWIKIKPLKLRNRQGQFIKSTESAIKSAAIAIAKSIGENGIEGINYYQDAINDTWEDYSEQLIQAYAKGVEQRFLLNLR
ncbi:hypothetical protein UFOVP1175_42 [uncultured Caudovirales phage]|uniref:Uncharacterized protein n=1 Tax=uncultured Caudovirales phage TaxID=2100421 RepID=A0A6J5RAI4_9CAUD|nr:hypothetical protein UFOVP1175_42 [uncultured Caudovirales phage]